VKSFFQEHEEIDLFNLQGVGPCGKILCGWYWDSHSLFPTYALFFPTYVFLFFFLLLPNFQCQLNSFDLIMICVFGRFLGLGFFKCQNISLVHQQVFHPISRGEIGLVYVKVITSTMYLKGLSPQSLHPYFCRTITNFH